MSFEVDFPVWAEPVPQPEAPPADDHRVEDLVNRFIAGKQEALFDAPDAYYRTTGSDAVGGAPAVIDRLNGLRDATLEQARDGGERAALGPRLDLHIDDARSGIDRYVARRQEEVTRQTIAERQRLIQRAAEREHDNDDKIDGLAEAHASAAQELARMNGEPEVPAMAAARSAIWRTAIDRHLEAGDAPQGIGLFDKVSDRLTPADRLSLDAPLQAAGLSRKADEWLERESPGSDQPLTERLAKDPNLSPLEKALVRVKLDVRDSLPETRRRRARQGRHGASPGRAGAGASDVRTSHCRKAAFGDRRLARRGTTRSQGDPAATSRGFRQRPFHRRNHSL
jgi:hypothetical protein